ncbi:helix-turn-helix domain-containing protein [Glycomyces terrestris]|nr:XRE family transcriptional regulator [Glycomyces terrestris]
MKLEKEWKAVGERVRRARVAEGLSQLELAQRIGVDDRTVISKIELGDRRIDGIELVQLAQVLRVPLDQFIFDPPPVISRRSGLVAEETTEAERSMFRVQTALVAWLRDVEQLVDTGLLDIPELIPYKGPKGTPSEARAAARHLRHILRIGENPTGSLMTVSERIGVLLAVVELEGDGASVVNGDYAVAVVNLKQDFGRRRSTAAHELGHVFLGDEYSSEIAVHASRDQREAVIDAFASEFLLPSAVLRPHHGRLTRSTLISIAARYQVSWSLAIRQAELAGCVEESVAREWGAKRPTRAEFLDSLGWAPQPDLERMRITPLLAHAVMAAYEARLITADRAVEIMRGQIDGPEDLPQVEVPREMMW